jgi:hypothetical protein
MPASDLPRGVADELRLTLDALKGLWEARRKGGWDLRVYDYTSNSWMGAEEAFSRPGTYERAVLTAPGGRPVRVTVLPPGGGGLSVDPASATTVGLWRSLGVSMRASQLELIGRLLAGRTEPINLEDLGALLEGSGEAGAIEARKALDPLLGVTGAMAATGGDGG